MKKIEIDNNTNVHILSTKKFKTISISVVLRRKLDRNEASINAIIPMILKNGSIDYKTNKEINEKLYELNGGIFTANVVKKGEEQLLQFFLETVVTEDKNTLSKMLEFLQSIIFKPVLQDLSENTKVFSDKYFTIEIENAINILKDKKQDKIQYANTRAVEKMCADEDFGVSVDGYIEDFTTLSNKKTYGHYLEIIENSPIEIFVVGDVEEKDIVENCDKYFKRDIPKNNLLFSTNKKPLILKNKRVNEEIGVNQGRICIGYRNDLEKKGKEFASFLIFCEILGGSGNSVLFRIIREEKSLCYSISSFIYRAKGILFVETGVDKNNIEETIQLIHLSIEMVKKGVFSLEQLENAKKNMEKDFMQIQDDPSSIMNFYLGQYLLKDSNNLEEFIKIFSEVKTADVIKIGKKLQENIVYTLT